MKRVGFYRELTGGSPSDPSIFAAPRGEHPDRVALLEYLQFGELHVGARASRATCTTRRGHLSPRRTS